MSIINYHIFENIVFFYDFNHIGGKNYLLLKNNLIF